MSREPERDWDALFEQLIEWVENGDTMAAFCKQEGMPSRGSFAWRIGKNPEWRKRFDEAREKCVEVLVEKTVALLKAPPPKDKFGKVDMGAIQWTKLKIEHAMRIAGVWSARYSPKKQVEHTGGVTFQVITGVPEPKAELPLKDVKVLDVQVGEAIDLRVPEKEHDGSADQDG